MRRSDGAPNGDAPSPEEVDRALRALWSGDGSSLDRLVPADGDGADHVPVDRLARGLLRPASVPPRAADDDRPPMVEVEGYTILHPLGRGGMGDVYIAEQHHPRRSVALKVARTGLGRDAARDRLLANEAEMLARLQHPGIATIYDVGETHDGRRTIAMELVEGTRLDHWLAEKDRPLARRLELFRGICGAVAYAHRQGVIHRDLKPTNILVDRGGDPKILDFGLAQGSKTSTPLDPQVLATGRLIGTLPYMSPEQVTGRFDEVDGRSDLYSIGVMLYLAITGRLPYPIHEDRPGEAVRAICELPPTPPRALDRSVPACVEGIVMRALQKDRSDRFADAGEMQHALERALETVAARGAEGSVLRRPETWSPPFLATVLLGFVAIGLAIGAAVTVALTARESVLARAAEATAATNGGMGRFFHDWFLDLEDETLDPARPLGALIDGAARRLAADDRLTPPSRARAHAAIGQKYRRLGEQENAALHYERAWRIRVVEFGAGDRRTLRTLHVVGRLRLQLGHLAEADTLSRDALRHCLALDDSVQTQRARRLRADVLDALGRADEAATVRAAIVEVAEPDEDGDEEDADASDAPDEGAAPPE